MPGRCQIPGPAFPTGLPVRWRGRKGTGLPAHGFAGAHLCHIQKCPPCIGLRLAGRRVWLVSVFVRLSITPRTCSLLRDFSNPPTNQWDATKARLEQPGSRGGSDVKVRHPSRQHGLGTLPRGKMLPAPTAEATSPALASGERLQASLRHPWARKHSSDASNVPCKPGLSQDLSALTLCLSFPTSSGSGTTATATTVPYGDIRNCVCYLQQSVPPTLQPRRCLFPGAQQGGNNILICKLQINQNMGCLPHSPWQRPVG